MRAWKEGHDVCSSLPQRLNVAESEFVECARSEKHDDQFDVGVEQCVSGANSSDEGVCKAMWSGTSSIFAVRGALFTRTCEFCCETIENVQESSERGESSEPLRKHCEILKMECGDGRVPLTMFAAL